MVTPKNIVEPEQPQRHKEHKASLQLSYEAIESLQSKLSFDFQY